MEMTARLTGDAKLRTLENGRQVVNFSVAINDSYQVKGKDQPVKLVTYVNCDYWGSAVIAPYLTKGKLVELQGRIGVNAYKTSSGEPKATLTFHVNTIKLHGGGSGQTSAAATAGSHITETADDLPF